MEKAEVEQNVILLSNLFSLNYDIILTDYKTSVEKRKLVLQKICHIGGVIALQSYQALKAYNSKPVKKRKTKKKSSVLYGLTGKR